MSINPLVASQLSPGSADKRLRRQQVALIEMREPDKCASERILGALPAPLSTRDREPFRIVSCA